MAIANVSLGSSGLAALDATQKQQANKPSEDGLGRDAFLQLLTAQLRYQDPEQPASGTEFVSQLAQFSNLESVAKLNTGLGDLVALQQVALSANLIGKQVAYQSPGASQPAHGVVQGVTVQDGQPQLRIGNSTVPIGQVSDITAV